MSKIALIDLDGTVADYDKAMGIALDQLASPAEPDWRTLSWGTPYLEARREYVANRPGFWSNLPRLEAGFEVVKLMQGIGFELMVLSKGPTSKPQAWAEKIQWCRTHLPDVPVTLTENKALAYGRVLFDDWPKYYEPWLDHRPRGLVIAMARKENTHVPSQYAGRVLRHYDTVLALDKVYDRLTEAYNR